VDSGSNGSWDCDFGQGVGVDPVFPHVGSLDSQNGRVDVSTIEVDEISGPLELGQVSNWWSTWGSVWGIGIQLGPKVG